MTELVAFIEIDQPHNGDTLTVRYARPQLELEQYGYVIPSISNINITPRSINIGGMDRSQSVFGRAETVDITFTDHQHSDFLFGQPSQAKMDGATYWRRWLARNPYHENYPVRVYFGEVGQRIEEMEVRHYLINRINGPSRGQVRMTCRDIFSLLEDRKAKAPKASRGVILNAIDASDTSLTLDPSGIGSEYPGSGYARINDEVVSFSRSGDVLTITRGQLNTEAAEHDEDDTVQLVLAYESESLQDIVEDLILNYTDLVSANIPSSEWAALDFPFSYTAHITEPENVSDLIGELARQAGFTIYPDISTNLIHLVPLTAEAPSRSFDERKDLIADSLSIVRQQDRRLSQVWVYYGQRNPTEPLDEVKNYRTRLIMADPESETLYGSPSVDQIFSRWISALSGQSARTAGGRILSLFRDPPIEAKFTLDTDRNIGIAERFIFTTDEIIDPSTEERRGIILMPVEVGRSTATRPVRAQQIRYFDAGLDDEDGTPVREVDIPDIVTDLNLRSQYDLQFSQAPTGVEIIRLIVRSGTIIGSTSVNNYALDIGSWPSGQPIEVIVESGAYVIGVAGNGGDGEGLEMDPDDQNGTNGGPAIITTVPITLDNAGIIGGGGGGGAGGVAVGDLQVGISGSGGGGGAGYLNGGQGGSAGYIDSGSGRAPGADGEDGTRTTGGAGGEKHPSSPSGQTNEGGDGGDLGQPGGSTSGASGGSPGTAINGDSLITFDTEGTIHGPRIN